MADTQTEEKVNASKPADTVPDAKSEPATNAANDTTAPSAVETTADAAGSATAEKTDNATPATATTDEAAKPEPAAPATTDNAGPAAAEGDAAATKAEEPAKTEGADKKPEPVAKEEDTKPEVPAKDDAAKATTAGPVWPEIPENHPINQLLKLLPDLIKDANGYSEVYGVTLDPAGPFHTKLILQKFLRANANNLDKAKEQLAETLKWRSTFKPLNTLDEKFAKDRFEGLGYVIEVDGVPGSTNKKDIITFNVYGAVKDNKATFGDVDGFLRWRVALMEKGIKKLDLANATEPIPDHGAGPDPYQGIQVHDYLSVSFIRQDPNVKAASRRTIDLFSKVYPETLSRKFFVNVPVVMGWMFQAFKLILPKETIKKFTVLSYGNQLAAELGPQVPEVYGGKAATLETVGEQTLYQ
ncbi:putative phosphatidylinositol transporter protein [Neofusicoccum parvum UCRNP2]|uniref:Phosphatidylinositol transfer protein SFH5 n=1 Tax=Botryosphaeria parva (strain UCR-NP2) TaxID=1287680 RepID=R1EI56_BOTPV|nr:putative phosphatidylinositol transporter protein [Neofusicoccum parvum UCRNP2]